ncbi:MAG TPA: hypothetical protein DEP72_07930 [Clostridiales bacterium]|nr:MAG: hypothetical protein A2Y18_06625 [Clostridiales bacterium GWD2_32_19]HCC08065.1 hypothetical protein [Clostridiales bacterium]
MIKVRKRAFAIIVRESKILFGYGKVDGKYVHFFIGGGIEGKETPEECVLRELREEANVDGDILFAFKNNKDDNEYAFLVDIGNQDVTLGYDPEEDNNNLEDKMLQKLEWIGFEEIYRFTNIDVTYFKLLYDECVDRNYNISWFDHLRRLLEKEEVI